MGGDECLVFSDPSVLSTSLNQNLFSHQGGDWVARIKKASVDHSLTVIYNYYHQGRNYWLPTQAVVPVSSLQADS